MSIKFLVLGGGYFGFGRGGSADSIFMGAVIFLNKSGDTRERKPLHARGTSPPCRWLKEHFVRLTAVGQMGRANHKQEYTTRLTVAQDAGNGSAQFPVIFPLCISENCREQKDRQNFCHTKVFRRNCL